MPALVAAGDHIAVPYQHDYGHSSRPAEVTVSDIAHPTVGFTALRVHHGRCDAPSIGRDWDRMVIWGRARLHPDRVKRLIAFSMTSMARDKTPWVEDLEDEFSPDNTFFHINRQPGAADAVLDANAVRCLSNLFRKQERREAPDPGTGPH